MASANQLANVKTVNCTQSLESNDGRLTKGNNSTTTTTTTSTESNGDER